ncbi:MAG TPA: hypothetical protein VK961_00635 [Chthoniobacter sp.]|nr:hypothetical protein [Chthoniobacter sp.]
MHKYYRVRITELTSTPTFRIPKSSVIVELSVRQGKEEAAEHRARHIAESAFMPLLFKKRVEKISYELTPIDKPASAPKMFTVIDGVKTWFALE